GRCARGISEGKDAPVFFGFGTPRGVFRNVAAAEVVFLRIESLFEKRALGTQEHEARTWSDGEDARSERGTHAARVVKKDVEGIVSEGSVAFSANLRGDRFGPPEEQQRVVDEVWTDIEEDAG